MIKLGELVMILDLHRQGLPVSAIARQLCIDRKPVHSAIAKGLEPPKYKEGREASAHEIWNAIIHAIVDNGDQFVHAVAADRCDDAKLGKVCPDRVDHCGQLANEEMPCPVQNQAGLLLGHLDRDKLHARALHRFADRLGIGGMPPLPLDVGLYCY